MDISYGLHTTHTAFMTYSLQTVQNKRAAIICAILLIGTTCATIFHYARFAFIGDHAPSIDSFLHPALNIFCDFYSLFDHFVRLKYDMPMNYLPGLFVPLTLLAEASKNNPYFAIQIVLAVYLAFLIPYIFISVRGMRQKIVTVFIIVVFCYPILFTLHTGNFEMLCFLLVAYGVTMRIKHKYLLAGILIGMAAAIKIYPAIFLFALVTKKNWKTLFGGAGMAFWLLLIAGFAMSGSIVENFNSWFIASQAGLENYSKLMVVSYEGLHFSHSLLNALRILAGKNWDITLLLPYIYAILALGVFGVLTIVHKPKHLYMKVLLLCCAICLFTPTSQDYKLLYFMIPLLLLLRSRRVYFHETVLCIMIAMLFIPKTYVRFYEHLYVNSNTLLNASIMFFILLYCAFFVLRDEKIRYESLSDKDFRLDEEIFKRRLRN